MVERPTSPSAPNILGPTAATSGLSFRYLIMGEMQSPVNFTSEFTRQTQSPRLFAMPMLFAFANPRFSELRINVNCGNISETISGVPSEEALSTTITSWEKSWQCSRSELRHSKTYFLAFQVTMTIDTSGRSSEGAGEGSCNVSDSAFIVTVGDSGMSWRSSRLFYPMWL